MTKKYKLEDYDRVAEQAYRYQLALNAMANGEASKPITIKESLHGGMDGCEYRFQFFRMANGYDYAIVTFRCTRTGQRDSVDVHRVDEITEEWRRSGHAAIWPRIAQNAVYQWQAAREEQAA